MKRLTHILIIIIGAVFIALTSCTHQKTWRIGISQCSSDDWRNKMNEEILREVLILGDSVEVEIISADDSNEKQINDLKYFRDNGFDLIAVAPNEGTALTPIVKEIYDSGTPIIVFDRAVDGDDFTAFQGANNDDIGLHAALLAQHYMGNGAKVIEIEGLKGSSPAYYRKLGFDAAADSLGIEILASAPANWNYEDAIKVTDSLLSLYPETNVIYAHNDRMAMGASDVATKRGMRDRIKIIGIDAAPNIGIKAVEDGVIDATFVYPT